MRIFILLLLLLGYTPAVQASPAEQKSNSAKPAAKAVTPEFEKRLAAHKKYSEIRLQKYREVFGVLPKKVFPSLPNKTGPFIDVLVYEATDDKGAPALILVTNGMSDVPLKEAGRPGPERIELIQYVKSYTGRHIERLQGMAWVPHYDHFKLVHGDTMQWPDSTIKGTPWKNAIFIIPMPYAHQDIKLTIEKEPVQLLWEIPISDQELKFKKEKGLDAFFALMNQKKMPMVLDDATRKSLL